MVGASRSSTIHVDPVLRTRHAEPSRPVRSGPVQDQALNMPEPRVEALRHVPGRDHGLTARSCASRRSLMLSTYAASAVRLLTPSLA